MAAKKGFRRITIDVPREDHMKIKLMATLLGKSMHSVIVESIEAQIKDFKGIEKVTQIQKQNTKEKEP